jgi:hypothetical protein
MLRKILLGLGLLLLLIQFIRPAKNNSNDRSNDVSTKYPVPTEVASILKVACNDCHSNETQYPWYANLQPLGWWMNNHIEHGKKHLNLSDFTSRKIAIQNHKFEEVIEMVEEDEMPIPSYTWLGRHPEAKLSAAQKETLINWAQTQMDSIKARYPADSLVMPRRTGAPGK